MVLSGKLPQAPKNTLARAAKPTKAKSSKWVPVPEKTNGIGCNLWMILWSPMDFTGTKGVSEKFHSSIWEKSMR